jgi:hypothetical protein
MEENMEKTNKKDNLPVWAWLTILVLTAVIVGTMLMIFLDQNQEVSPATLPATQIKNPVSNTTTPTAISATDWKTYEDKVYGFSLKYPSDWNDLSGGLKESFRSKTIEVGRTDNDFVEVQVTNRTLDNIIDQGYLNINKAIKIEKQESIKIDGKDAKKVTLTQLSQFGSMNNVVVYIPQDNNNNIYIDYRDGTTEGQGIIDSFKFTQALGNFTKAGNLTTFQNNIEHYSISYSNDWWLHADDKGGFSISKAVSDNAEAIKEGIDYSFSLTIENVNKSAIDYLNDLRAQIVKNNQEGPMTSSLSKEITIKIAGEDALKVHAKGGPNPGESDVYYLSGNSKIYTFGVPTKLGDGPVYDTTNYVKGAEQILSTFQFTK